MARPKKKASDRRDGTFRIRMTDKEREQVNAFADKLGLDSSAWARMVLLAASENVATKTLNSVG